MVTQLQWGGPCTEGEHDLKSELWKKAAYPIVARKQRKDGVKPGKNIGFKAMAPMTNFLQLGPIAFLPFPNSLQCYGSVNGTTHS